LDLIAQQPVDPTTGLLTYTGNVANMKSHGVDVRIFTRNLQRKFEWATNYLFNYNKDEVTEYFTEPLTGLMVTGEQIQPLAGKPVYALYSYGWAGLDPATGDPMGTIKGAQSKEYGQLVGNNVKVDDLQYNGPTRPVVSGSVLNTFSFSRFSLSVNISYKLGYYFRRSSINYNAIQNPNFLIAATHKDFENRWQKPGDERNTIIPSLVFPANSQRDEFYLNSSVLVERGDHIRLQDIRFSYQFGLNRIFKQLELYSYLNNVGLLWKQNDWGIDPDFQRHTPVAPLSVSFGLNASF
jgi:TonB-dependent starch-binding outer membrane protein SusC